MVAFDDIDVFELFAIPCELEVSLSDLEEEKDEDLSGSEAPEARKEVTMGDLKLRQGNSEQNQI